MKKRVGILLPSINAGGAERAATRITKILSDEYDVFLILFSDQYLKYEYDGDLINLGIGFSDSKNIFSKLTDVMKRTYRLRREKKKLNLDVVISFMDTPNLVNVLSRTSKCNVITSVRNYDFVNKKIISKIVYRLVHYQSDLIITVSEYIKESLNKELKIPLEKIKTIYNPYNVKHIVEESMEDTNIFDNNYKKFRFVSVGRIVYQKGFWHLIKAFKIVNSINPNTELIIIGRDESDGKAEQLVKKLELQNSVKFLGYQKNPFKFVRKCDVYVLSSLFEGFPNSLVEAMALGKPVIASNCKSGPLEILNDITELEITDVFLAKYGILIPDLDKNENWNINDEKQYSFFLSEAMRLIMNNSQMYMDFSEKSLQRANDFNYQVCGEKYAQEINKLLND